MNSLTEMWQTRCAVKHVLHSFKIERKKRPATVNSIVNKTMIYLSSYSLSKAPENKESLL